jgi:hypothetical protein
MTVRQTLGSLSVINVQATKSFGALWSSSRTASLYNQRINKIAEHIVDDYGILPGCCELFLFVGVSRQCLRHLSLANCFSWNSCVKQSIVTCILFPHCRYVQQCGTKRRSLYKTAHCVCRLWFETWRARPAVETIWTRMSSVTAANLSVLHSRRLGLNSQSSEIILVIFLSQVKILGGLFRK